MPIDTPTATLRNLALDCVQRITRDLTDPAFPPGMSSQAEGARYSALITWATTGQQIAAGEWSESRMHDFIQECQQRFECCEGLTMR
jgi:hypothetical protein